MRTIGASRLLRFAALPVLAGLIAYVEIRRQPGFFRLVSFGLAFLIVADLASLLRGHARDALLVAASLIFGLTVIELAANVLESRAKTMLEVSFGWADYEPVLGWGASHPGAYHAMRMNPVTGANIYSVDYTFGPDLQRRTVSAKTGRPFVFFGDSFTFGFGLNDADTLPQAFSDLMQRRERVLNLASGGYSPQQFLRALETGFHDDLIGPDPKLFVFLTLPWHAERTACKSFWAVNAPRYELQDGKVVFKGRCFEGWRVAVRRALLDTAAYRIFVAPYARRITHDDVELYIRELTAAVALARQKYRVDTLVPYLRDPNALIDTGFTDDSVMQRLRDGGAIVIDASLDAERARGTAIEIPGDGHPSALANRLRAQQIKSYADQHMPTTASQLE